MREDAANKNRAQNDERLMKMERQLKAKEYAKKQRELITKSKQTSSRASVTNTVTKDENDSPNVGSSQIHKEIIQQN